MTALQRLISFANAALLLPILIGLAVRQRTKLSFSFVAYAVVVAASLSLMAGWPERFFIWDFWALVQVGQDLLKFAIALELATLVFSAFATAARTVRAAVLLLCVAILVALLNTPSMPATAELFVTLRPWILNGAAGLFILIFIFALWYRIPLHPWHKAILFGFIPYVLIFTVLMDLVRRLGFSWVGRVSYINTFAYFGLLLYWNTIAWRPRRPPPGDPATIRRIQPWLVARTGGMW